MIAEAWDPPKINVPDYRCAFLVCVRRLTRRMISIHVLFKVGLPCSRKLPDSKPTRQLKNRRVPLAYERRLGKPRDTPTIPDFSKLGGALCCKRAGADLLPLIRSKAW